MNEFIMDERFRQLHVLVRQQNELLICALLEALQEQTALLKEINKKLGAADADH